jgi:hypothetical protein
LPEDGVPSKCEPCKYTQSICTGGRRIGPRPGFWRKSENTSIFSKCFNADACVGLFMDVGNVKQKYRATGWCKEGYYGAFCASCKPDWSLLSNYICTKCDNATLTMLKCFGMLALMLLVTIGLVASTLNGSKER